MGATAFIADPSRDANVQIHVQVRGELVLVTRKAMRNAADERGAVLAQNRHKILVRIALVQEYRLAEGPRQLELAVEGLLLCGARRQVAEVVQPAFPDRDHLGRLRELPQVPAERLLLETDGPYLLPRDLQLKPASRRNEPAYLPHIAAAVARARREPLTALAHSSTAAARRLFALPGVEP